MYNVKGFATHSSFVDNNIGIVNPIGELSPQAKTFSREIGYYNNQTTPQINLVTFLCQKDGTEKVLDITYRDNTITILNEIYQATLQHAGQIYPDNLLQTLIEKFASMANDFRCGTIVTDGTYWLPEWVSWRFNQDDASYFKFWFSDKSFRNQYDETYLIVTSPLANIDDFFLRSQDVIKKIKAINPSELAQRIQDSKGGIPESIIRTEVYEYRDPLDNSNRYLTPWTVLIYGEAGNNIDSIKDAVAEQILAKSTHTRDEWAKIFPDIFKRTEFILIPDWESMAIPNRTIKEGIYSPFTRLSSVNALFSRFAPSYPVSHIISYGTVFGHTYKSLYVAIISSNDNRDGLFDIKQLYPDYIAVSSYSQDFNRQSEETRRWSEAISEMISIAEKMTKYSDISRNYSKVTRGGLLYVVKSINNIHYLVSAKQNTVVMEPK